MSKTGILLALILLLPVKSYCFTLGKLDFNIIGQVKEAYDDNITFLKDDPKKDFRTDLIIGLAASYQGRLDNLSLRGNVARHMYDKYNDFNNTSEDFSVIFNKEFTRRDRISLKDNFVHAYEPGSFEDEFGNAADRYKYTRNAFGADFTKDLMKQLSVIVSYFNEFYAYSRKDLNDSFLNSGSFELDYALSSKNVLLGYAGYFNRQFEQGGHQITKRLSGGLRHYLTKQLYFDGRAGVDFVSGFGMKDDANTYISASLINDVDPNTNLAVSYTKQASSTAYSQDIFESQRLSLSLSRQFLNRLRMSLGAFYGEGEYTNADIKDKLKGANASLSYDLAHNMKADVSYNYSDVTSNVESREYERGVGSVGFTFEF